MAHHPPPFRLSQDAEFVHLHAELGKARISGVRVDIEGERGVLLHAPPFSLRLELPSDLVDDERCKAVYDIDSGCVDVKIPKKEHGEIFPDLDLVSRVLVPVKKSILPPTHASTFRGLGGSGEVKEEGRHLIEVVGEERAEGAEDCVDEDVEGEGAGGEGGGEREELPELMPSRGYGFNRNYRGYFVKGSVREQLPLIVSLSDPEGSAMDERHAARLAADLASFSSERFFADSFEAEDDPLAQGAFQYLPYWEQEGTFVAKKEEGVEEGDVEIKWTDEELEQMRKLPRREYLLSAKERTRTLCSIGCILIASAYDIRMTQGVPNVETPWTITTLSPSLNFLVDFDSPSQAIVATLRALLSFPYLRSWPLARLCLRDSARHFLLGRRVILRTLLAVREVFRKDETRHHLNKIFITDACVWIQKLSARHVQSFAKEWLTAASTLTPAALDLPFDPPKDLSDIKEEEGDEHESDDESDDESGGKDGDGVEDGVEDGVGTVKGDGNDVKEEVVPAEE